MHIVYSAQTIMALGWIKDVVAKISRCRDSELAVSSVGGSI
jgi:hypothetical protein